MLPWQSVLAWVGRRLVRWNLAGYRADVEENPAGLKVRFPDATIWLVGVALSVRGSPPWPSAAERQALAWAAEGVGGTPVLARVWLSGRRLPRVSYHDLRVGRETHLGLFLSPGGQP